MVVSTFGRDQKLMKTLKQIEKNTAIKFHYAKKTASSLGMSRMPDMSGPVRPGRTSGSGPVRLIFSRI